MNDFKRFGHNELAISFTIVIKYKILLLKSYIMT